MLSGGIHTVRGRPLVDTQIVPFNAKRNRHVLVVYCWLAVFSLAIFGLLQVVVEKNTLVGQLELLGAVTVLIVLGGLRVTNNVDIARSCFLLTIVAMLAVMLITGGTEGTGIFWFYMFPVAAFFLAGKQEGASWAIFLLAMVFLLWVISTVYNIPVYYSDIAVRQLMVTLLVVSFALYVYQGSRESWELQARQSQKQLRANLQHEAESHAKIDFAKSELVTLASHQLRTPISAIGWNSEMLLSGDVGKLTKDQSTYVQGVYDSNRRLGAIVDSMLTVSSLEMGNLFVHAEPTDLVGLLRKLLADEFKAYPDRKIEIKEQFATDISKVKLDTHIVKQIFKHLFSNAIKYTPDGGTVEVRVVRTDKKLNPHSKGSIEVIVADTGYGIPADEQKNVFAKLFRAANIKSKDVDGTGLGLYIVKELMDKVGGRVAFESKENEGSTFTISLPLEGMATKERGGENGDRRTE